MDNDKILSLKWRKNSHTTLCWKRINRTVLFFVMHLGKPIQRQSTLHRPKMEKKQCFNYKFFFKSCAKEDTSNSPFRTIARVNWSNKFAIGEEAITDPKHRLLPGVRFYVCFIMDQRSNSKSSICKQHSQIDHGIKGCFIQIYQQKGKFQSIFRQEVNKQKIYNCGA